MTEKKGLIAFDVDGVLQGYGGKISRDIIDLLRQKWVLGIISARADHVKVREEFQLDFSYLYDGSAFSQAMSDYPNLGRYIYVSDNAERKTVAEGGGWEFYQPEEFTASLRNFLNPIFDELFKIQVDGLKLALCVVFYIFNVLDYYTTKRGLEVGLREGNPFARAIMKMGWRKYQAIKLAGPALFVYQALTSEDPNYIWTACLAFGAASFAYAAIQNALLIAGRRLR
ncbi:hypothetical protein DRO19_02275 [Candidatus Bathyarchaeota archaeon]|nr:MAG: hypothetical protein DRO19_02275 [Candidatus Bathyarchaeota archaeon]